MIITLTLAIYKNESHGPSYKILFNGDTKYKSENNLQPIDNIIIEVKPKKLNNLELHHYNKNTKFTTPTSDIAIELLNIAFDGVKINRNVMFTQTFTPGPRVLTYGHNINSSCLTNNCYFGYNGTWKITFPKNYSEWVIQPYFNEDFEYG